MSATAEFKYDSKGRAHYLLKQEFAKSCGPACVAMVEGFYKLKCMINPEERVRQLSQKYPGSFSKEEGTTMENLYEVLSAESVKAKAPANIPRGEFFDYLYYNVDERTPAIVQVQWSGGGYHFAVCRIADKDQPLVFLDPLNGVIEVEKQNLPRYRATGQLTGNVIITQR
ncbi:MAG: cysteine peptidase family C39 domain-containing protein [Blastocatellia bacterium]